jgi:ferredoxin
VILNGGPPAPKYAFLGVRACDLAAVARQDRVLTQDRYIDPVYQPRREASFFVAVDCNEPSGNCFCASMGSGPCAASGYDILLSEALNGESHSFFARSGTTRGEELLRVLTVLSGQLQIPPPTDTAPVTKSIDTGGLRQLLYDSFDHPQWDRIAARCLMCANCTMVCPTCFCVTVEDSSDVTHSHAERWRRWDTCFTQNFTYIHGGSVRMSPKSRYRQWLTHKFAAWIDQFGEPGCVGCGRCITWCPAGIDITEELAAFRDGRNVSGSPNS